MQEPAFPSPPPEPPDRSGPHVVVVAAGALAAGALTTGAVFVLVFVIRGVVGFVAAHWPWLVGVLALVAFLAVMGAGAIAAEKYEAEQREAHLREVAHLENVDVMTGEEFEELTADLLRRDGYRSVEVFGRTGDRGVDVLAVSDDGDKIAVQCKRQKNPVGADRVRNLIGAIHGTYAGHVGVLVTNSRFTKLALAEADGRLMLLDRAQFARWMDGEPLTI